MIFFAIGFLGVLLIVYCWMIQKVFFFPCDWVIGVLIMADLKKTFLFVPNMVGCNQDCDFS